MVKSAVGISYVPPLEQGQVKDVVGFFSGVTKLSIPAPTSGDPLRPSKSCILKRFSTPYIKPFRLSLVGVGILNFVTPEPYWQIDLGAVYDVAEVGWCLGHWFVASR